MMLPMMAISVAVAVIRVHGKRPGGPGRALGLVTTDVTEPGRSRHGHGGGDSDAARL